jgi:hypothetical protein
MTLADILKTKTTGRIVIVLFVVVLLGLSGYFYNQYRIAQQRLNNPQQAVLDDVHALTATVGKLMILPSEDPTVATVADVDKLKGQRFFANAQNGDKVLIYNNSKEAVLYRPSINKIVEIMPINIQVSPTPAPPTGVQAGTVTPAAQALVPTAIPTPVSQAYKFTLRNGTLVTGLAKRYETEVTAKIPTAQIVGSDNAKRRDYSKTTIVAVSAAAQGLTQEIAGKLGIMSGTLPAGEDAPAGADFLIIIGSDKAGVNPT